MTRAFLATAACSGFLLAACSGHSVVSPTSTHALTLQDVVSSISVDAAPGTARGGTAPASTVSPTISVTGNTTFINGGTLPVAIASPTPFDTVFMALASKTVGLDSSGGGGIDGYYEIHLPSARTAATAVLAFPQSSPLSQVDLLFAVAVSSSAPGPFARLTTTALQVGSGDVQVTLSWDVDSDVDLHVVDPAGEEIFYGHRQSQSGGTLDLDSNAACALDHKRNENITWPQGKGPRGHYVVRVDYWDSCSVAQTNYTVRMLSTDGVNQIVSGTFTGSGDAGGAGAGRLVGTFDRNTGPTASSAGIVAPIVASFGKYLKTPGEAAK